MAGNPETVDINDINNSKHKEKCKKNTSHEKYISKTIFDQSKGTMLRTFKGKEVLLKEDVHDFIQILISLSVKIEVKFKNPSDDRSGSGTIVDKIELDENYYGIKIITCHHIVKNSDEARKAECLLHFHGPENNLKRYTLFGRYISEDNIDDDWCSFICKVKKERIEEYKEVLDMLELYQTKIDQLMDDVKMNRDKLCILVSHPHECYTYVSIGELTEDNKGYLEYNTPTCIGSSGGYIFAEGTQSNLQYVHCSGYPVGAKEDKQINMSSGGFRLKNLILENINKDINIHKKY